MRAGGIALRSEAVQRAAAEMGLHASLSILPPSHPPHPSPAPEGAVVFWIRGPLGR